MIIQHKRLNECLIALFILFTSNETVLAQAISGTVVGTVQDSSGAMVANATVTGINSDTGISQATITSAEGEYTIPNLAPGTYKITAQLPGFTTAVASSTAVRVAQTTRIDFTLSPGETSQQINVIAESPLVQSTTSDLGEVVESKQIQALPLNSRLFEQLVTIILGAVQAGWGRNSNR